MEIPSVTDLQALLIYLCPGVVFSYGRRIFLTSQVPIATKDTIIGLIAISLIYILSIWIVTGNAFSFLTNLRTLGDRLLVAVFIIILPLAIGCIYGILERNDTSNLIVAWLFSMFGKQPPVIPGHYASAWTALFVDVASRGDMVLVSTKSTGEYCGVLGDQHYASNSSDQAPDDLYIDELWDIDDDGVAQGPTEPPRGAWLPYAEITSIQLIRQIDKEDESDGTKSKGTAQKKAPTKKTSVKKVAAKKAAAKATIRAKPKKAGNAKSFAGVKS